MGELKLDWEADGEALVSLPELEGGFSPVEDCELMAGVEECEEVKPAEVTVRLREEWAAEEEGAAV